MRRICHRGQFGGARTSTDPFSARFTLRGMMASAKKQKNAFPDKAIVGNVCIVTNVAKRKCNIFHRCEGQCYGRVSDQNRWIVELLYFGTLDPADPSVPKRTRQDLIRRVHSRPLEAIGSYFV